MKAITKIIAAALSAATLLAFPACGGGEEKNVYSGVYSYENYGTVYGFKVKVRVEEGVIKNVEIVDSDYKRVSDAFADWTEQRRDNYFSNEQRLLNAYKGKSVEEVLSAEVARGGDVPLASDDAGFIPYPDGLLISGATQSSGRLLLAVQNALSKI